MSQQTARIIQADAPAPITHNPPWAAAINAGQPLRIWMVDCGEGGHVWAMAMLADSAPRQPDQQQTREWELIVSEKDIEVIRRLRLRRRAGVPHTLIDEQSRPFYHTQSNNAERLLINSEIYKRVCFVKLSQRSVMPPFKGFDLIVTGPHTSFRDAHLRLLLRPGGNLLALDDIWDKSAEAWHSPPCDAKPKTQATSNVSHIRRSPFSCISPFPDDMPGYEPA